MSTFADTIKRNIKKNIENDFPINNVDAIITSDMGSVKKTRVDIL